MWRCEVNYKVYTIICLLLSCYAEGCRPSWIWGSWPSLFSHAPFSVQLLWGCCQGGVLRRMVGFSHGSPVVGWLGVLCHWLAALCAWSAFILQCQQWLLFCILNVVRHSSDRPMACQHLNDSEPFEILWINRCWHGFLGWLIASKHYTSGGTGRGDLCFVYIKSSGPSVAIEL